MKKILKSLIVAMCVCIAMLAMATCQKGDAPLTNESETTIDIIQESVELELFEEYVLQYVYDGEDALTWLTEDSSIATVENGKLIALKKGETKIILQSGNLTDSCVVKVKGLNVNLLNISLEQSQLALYAGETYTLSPELSYRDKVLEDAQFVYQISDETILNVSENGVVKERDKEIVWTSSDTNIATVDNGLVVGISVGTAEITASYVGDDGKTVKDVVTIIVSPVVYKSETLTDIVKKGLHIGTSVLGSLRYFLTYTHN